MVSFSPEKSKEASTSEFIIRIAGPQDSPEWLELIRSNLGDSYPAQEVYDLDWIAQQLDPDSGEETWVIEQSGRLIGSISFLKPADANANPVANLGRNLFRPEAFFSGGAMELIRQISSLAEQRQHMLVIRVSAQDSQQQLVLEKQGFLCVGYQPCKHIFKSRQGILFYIRAVNQVLDTRVSLSESLPQVSELASHALQKLQIPRPLVVRDGATGYPIQTEIGVLQASHEDFEMWRAHSALSNPPAEVSTGFNRNLGLMRVSDAGAPIQALLAQIDSKITCGMSFIFDPHDKCVRILDAFAIDDISLGALFQHLVTASNKMFGAAYLEIDILMTAPRLLKTAEQLGFVPVAYLPAFFSQNNRTHDVVKLVKLNMVYSVENTGMTTDAVSVVKIIDQNLQDQKVGIAVINLLKTMQVFEGLGDGELRKVARLFKQKLYQPGEVVFKRGDSGEEAYIVMRGQVDMVMEESPRPIASITNGHLFGELAFLDGVPRMAKAVCKQPTVMLVIHRDRFAQLIRQEPHLGMVIMKNMANDLAAKLRRISGGAIR